MILTIRHFPDRKRPCIVLEEGNRAVVIGYLTDREREGWLRKAFNLSDKEGFAIVAPGRLFDEGGDEE